MSLIWFLFINWQPDASQPEANGSTAQGENSKYVPFLRLLCPLPLMDIKVIMTNKLLIKGSACVIMNNVQWSLQAYIFISSKRGMRGGL